MSTLNMHPPQTYSRLFRPWDTSNNSRSKMSSSASSSSSTATSPPKRMEFRHSHKHLVKSEYVATSAPTEEYGSMATSHNNNNSLIKSEHLSYCSNESDRECASSSSSSISSKSYDESFNNSLPMESMNTAASESASSPAITITTTHSSDNLHKLNDYQINGAGGGGGGAYLYGSAMDTHAMSHPSGHMPSHMVAGPSASDLYYAAAAAAAASACAAAAGVPPAALGPSTPPNAYALDPYALSMMEQEYARVMAEEAHLKAVNARKQRPKKFKCPHCDVAFSNNGQLKGHIRIHTGERPFKCDVETCGKTFTRNEELTRHKRIHTGLRPYPCSACGKKFGRRDHLKKHMKTHMPQERQLGAAIFVPMYPYLYGY